MSALPFCVQATRWELNPVNDVFNFYPTLSIQFACWYDNAPGHPSPKPRRRCRPCLALTQPVERGRRQGVR